jgi:hypothetical protein
VCIPDRAVKLFNVALETAQSEVPDEYPQIAPPFFDVPVWHSEKFSEFATSLEALVLKNDTVPSPRLRQAVKLLYRKSKSAALGKYIASP